MRRSFARFPSCWAENYDFLAATVLDTSHLALCTSILGPASPGGDEEASENAHVPSETKRTPVKEEEEEEGFEGEGEGEGETSLGGARDRDRDMDMDMNKDGDEGESTDTGKGKSKSKSKGKKTDTDTQFTSYETLYQLVLHLRRDWTDDGAVLREKLYGGMIEQIQRFSGNARGQRVLVPGAGLGRLALELAHHTGASVECVESSMPFALAFQNIFRIIRQGGTRADAGADADADATEKDAMANGEQGQQRQQRHTFYPLLHLPFMDEWDFNTRMRPSLFPDTGEAVAGWADGSTPGSISLRLAKCSFYTAAEFADSYDVVATSFFIDTGNIIHNMATIAHVLKPGGLWVNAGPLHYHRPTLPLSHTDVLALAESMGLELLHEHRVTSDYAAETEVTMKPEHYNHPLCVWRLAHPEARLHLQTLLAIPEPTYADDGATATIDLVGDLLDGQAWPSPNFYPTS
jgi:carnosine N-methyltransferase